jgi:hypothetical protein
MWGDVILLGVFLLGLVSTSILLFLKRQLELEREKVARREEEIAELSREYDSMLGMWNTVYDDREEWIKLTKELKTREETLRAYIKELTPRLYDKIEELKKKFNDEPKFMDK